LLAVFVVEVILEVEHVRGAVPKPGQSLAVGDTVVGTKAGEVVAEGMEFVLVRLLELVHGTEVLEPLQERPLADRTEDEPGLPAGLE
jgi:hypothetical protein